MKQNALCSEHFGSQTPRQMITFKLYIGSHSYKIIN